MTRRNPLTFDPTCCGFSHSLFAIYARFCAAVNNTSDNTTLADFLTKIEDQYGRSDRVWIMDRGIPTEETLEAMREGDTPVRYLVGTPKGRLTRLEKSFLEIPWQEVRQSVDVKLLTNDGELFVLVRSERRVLKERSMRRRRLKKLWKRLGDPNHFAVQRRSLTPLWKQRHLPRARLAFQHLDRAPPRRTLAVIDLPQIQHLALHHPPATHAHVLHHAPIAVFLTVLVACLAAHKHEQIVGAVGSRIKDQGRHYTGNRPWSSPKNRDLQRQSSTKIAETHGELAKSG